MFRKIANRVNSAFSTTEDNNISQLTAMGFSAEQSRNALDSTNGDITQAANLLLASGSDSNSSSTTTYSRQNNAYRQPTTNRYDVDSDLQKALKESLDIHKKQTNNKKEVIDLTKPKRKIQNQKLPPKLTDKSKEEQISRCVSRLQSHPRAVDTLLIAFTAIRDDPGNQKYRSIDTTTPGYKETLLNVPGAHDLLTCCRFQKQGQYLKLDRFHIDLALLWLAISTLQNATSSQEYINGKQLINFHKTVQQMLEYNVYNPSNDTSKLSSEPDTTQNSSLIHLQFTDTITHKRRFHPDDTLQDIITWIGTLASQVPRKITTDEWVLVDKGFSPPRAIPMNIAMFRKTLQTLGWWPSCKLQILMKDMVVNDSNLHFGNEHGLGVALS